MKYETPPRTREEPRASGILLVDKQEREFITRLVCPCYCRNGFFIFLESITWRHSGR